MTGTETTKGSAVEPKGAVVGLMRKMGVKGHPFDPMPPAQHRWQSGKGEPPLYRIWSWMCGHTIHYGYRCEYAVTPDGAELHLEHIATDLEMDVHNVRLVWKEGVAKGLWRNGNKPEERRRMYLCGTVTPQAADKSTEEAAAGVCTNPLKPYILNQINKLSSDRQREFWGAYERQQRLRKDVQAELIAASRLILDQREDTLFSEFGINKIREKKKDPEPERVERLNGLFSHLQGFVQTLESSVQSPEFAVYNAANSDRTNPATLLTEKIQKEREERASSYSGAPAPGVRTPSSNGQKPAGSVPAAAEPEFRPEEEEAVELCFSEFPRMQHAFRHADFSKEIVSRERKTDRILVRKVLDAVGAEQILPFLVDVAAKFKGLDRNALGKMPSRSPMDPHGPRSFGLILEWAQDFSRRQKGAGA